MLLGYTPCKARGLKCKWKLLLKGTAISFCGLGTQFLGSFCCPLQGLGSACLVLMSVLCVHVHVCELSVPCPAGKPHPACPMGRVMELSGCPVFVLLHEALMVSAESYRD